MFYVYILWSDKDRRTYVGFTPDLTRRLEKHNSVLVHQLDTEDRVMGPLCCWDRVALSRT